MNNPQISMCQFQIGNNKIYNVGKARKFILEACKKGSNIIVLPECFICPYNVNIFKENAEKIFDLDDKSCIGTRMLIDTSNTYKDVIILGGSIIEETNEGNLYNTCIICQGGKIINTYRKNNLYTIHLNEHNFSEGSVLTPGNEPCIVNTKYGNIGVGICFDIRFIDLANFYKDNNCFLIIYPGSFNRITGPKHWKLLQQARAIDNQLFVASCSSACVFGTAFESYGKSFIISPFGDIIKETNLDLEEIITDTINISEIESVRRKIPILKEFNLN